MASTEAVSNGTFTAGAPLTSPSPAPPPPPPEVEQTLARLSAYRNVRGVMILARGRGSLSGAAGSGAAASGGPAASAGVSGSGIIQSTGAVFEGESGRRYAGSLEAVVAATTAAVSACDEGDELKLMRIRTKRHELIITPDERYLLVVLQDPGQ